MIMSVSQSPFVEQDVRERGSSRSRTPSPMPVLVRAKTKKERQRYEKADDEYVDPVTDEWEDQVLELYHLGEHKAFQKEVSRMLMNHKRFDFFLKKERCFFFR